MASEKYLNLNLNDENAGKIAEIISNKTAKKILAAIAETESELSETDIANKLEIPLNTVDYNIKKLLSAGLIEKSSNFFWSVKGKKIPTFRLANKKIIISTKSKYSGIIGSMLIFGALGFLGNVFKNISSNAKDIYYANSYSPMGSVNDLAEKTVDTGVSLAGSAPTVPESANLIVSSSNSFSFASLFSNIWMWVIAGVLIGAILFFVYKKTKELKGGNKL